MTRNQSTVFLVMMLLASSALADDDCHDPVGHWQSQEKLRHSLESQALEVRRIKVDDGCYEVYGRDGLGNRFEAKYFPATLQLRSLKIRFREGGGNIAEYMNKPPAKDDSSNAANAAHPRHGRREKHPADSHE